MASFAMAPYHWWGLLIPALSGLYAMLCQRGGKFWSGLALGWMYGFGFFLFSLSWIGNALLIDGNPYAWAYPLAVCALPAALAFFPALACALAARFLTLPSLPGLIGFAALMAVSEWLRGHILTGFPWNLAAYGWGNSLELMQALSLIDIYSLSLFITLLCAAPGLCALKHRALAPWVVLLALGGVLAGLYGYGYTRLQNAPLTMNESVSIRIIQPDIPQQEKWDSAKTAGHFERLVQMSLPTGNEAPGKTTMIVWPETALSSQYTDNTGARTALAEMLRAYPGPAMLITGALIRNALEGTLTNSVIGMDARGVIQTRYDKFHLVPFGEYIPLQPLIGTAIPTVTQFSGFLPGSGPRTQKLQWQGTGGAVESFSFSPLVCYEILFPGAVISPDSERPQAIVNVTNDGWYGFSAGPHQHFLKARFRAVEEGLPVIRAANNGISAVIDPYGRPVIESRLFVEGVYNADLPAPLPPRPYKTLWIFPILMGLCGIFVVFLRKTANFEL